ncbi:DJ-1/PfpI family protein [Candidatus Acetothermia bacterium]|nr:DJ-1/PfpI family protein [Candidatus Acetothermia bacterium]MBI3644164.1 DJ-1/PfpI family protein [Candidatus Acetothermia bacterium]
MKSRNVAILIFDEVEVLDFCGPFEVFSVTGKRDNLEPFNVYTVAERPKPVLARNLLSINPRYLIDQCPEPDIIVVPGGFGTRKLLQNENVLNWIREKSESCEYLLSVCTGALVLAEAGLLKGLKATTHFMALDMLKELAPDAKVLDKERVVDNGKIILSAGVSAGIDMSFYVVSKILGKRAAAETARYIEYPWNPKLRAG